MAFRWWLIALVLALFSSGEAQVLIENRGQRPATVLAEGECENGRFFVESDRLRYHLMDGTHRAAGHTHGGSKSKNLPSFDGHVFQVVFMGANHEAPTTFSHQHSGYYNFFLGKDPSRWRSQCRSFGAITRNELYPSIDYTLYTHRGGWKYDFIVHPGGDPSQIGMRYDGLLSLRIEHGQLRCITAVGEVLEAEPVAWQEKNGMRMPVECLYILQGQKVSFHFPKGYDRALPLVIDPQLVFASYSGSFANNFGFTATYDSDGHLYSGSSAFGLGYPTTLGAYQSEWAGGNGTGGLTGTDMALSKFAVNGTSLIWSTYLGGANDELPHSLVCNESNELLVYGTTSSPDFPVTPGAYDTVFSGGNSFAPFGVGTDYVNGSDIVITHFNAGGNALIGSTFVGGTGNDGVNTAPALKFNYADEFRGEIDLDSEGNIVIASSTFSTDFPVVNAVQSIHGGGQDGCLFKMNPSLTQLIWSTFLGGASDDSGYSAAFDDADNVYFCGGTASADFPVVDGAYQSSYQGGQADGWLAAISANGNTLLRSTFLGSTAYDQLYFVDTDDSNQPHVYGQTLAPNSTFIINAAWGQTNSGMLVAKLDDSLENIVWSTVFGSGNNRCDLSPTAFLVDVCDNIYLSGWGGAVNASNPLTGNTVGLPITPNALQASTDGSDFYVLVMQNDASDIVYGSFFGGNISPEHVDGGTSRFDRKGIIYQSVCAGCQNNDDFPTFPSNVVSTGNNSTGCNTGVFKFDFELPLLAADFPLPPTLCVNSPLQLTSTSINATQLLWDFGDGATASGTTVSHIYTEAGNYTITLVANNPATCNASDTLRREIEILEPVVSTLPDASVCGNETVIIGPSNPDLTATYQWLPGDALSDPLSPNPSFSGENTTEFILLIEHGLCTDTLRQTVTVTSLSLDLPPDTTLCDEVSLELSAVVFPPGAGTIEWSDTEDFTNLLNEGPLDVDIVVTPVAPQTYYCAWTVGECVVASEVFVNLVSFQTTIEGDFSVCAGDTVSLAIQDPNEDFQYTWSPEEVILSGQNTPAVEVVVNDQLRMYVISQTPFDCAALDSVLIDVSPLSFAQPSATAVPATIVEGGASQLSVLPSGYNYTWTPAGTLSNAAIQNPIASPGSTTTYTVLIEDGECAAQANVRVSVVEFVCGPPSVFVPNAFTPDANNTNDRLFVRVNSIDRFYFAIYNRWGEMVFESTTPTEGWDGTFRDRPCDPDVFVYYLKVDCGGGQSYQEEGNITLIR